MKRGNQNRKQSPTTGSKCSKSLQKKSVTPNTISLSETEDGSPREDPSDDGKSVSYWLDMSYSKLQELLSSEGNVSKFIQQVDVSLTLGTFMSLGLFFNKTLTFTMPSFISILLLFILLLCLDVLVLLYFRVIIKTKNPLKM